MKASVIWKMFYKEIWEQTEPGRAFLEYLEAQIFKISPLSANNGGTFVGLMCIPVCPQKNSGYTTDRHQKCATKIFIIHIIERTLSYTIVIFFRSINKWFSNSIIINITGSSNFSNNTWRVFCRSHFQGKKKYVKYFWSVSVLQEIVDSKMCVKIVVSKLRSSNVVLILRKFLLNSVQLGSFQLCMFVSYSITELLLSITQMKEAR